LSPAPGDLKWGEWYTACFDATANRAARDDGRISAAVACNVGFGRDGRRRGIRAEINDPDGFRDGMSPREPLLDVLHLKLGIGSKWLIFHGFFVMASAEPHTSPHTKTGLLCHFMR
jgi:hypothetical protein